MEKLPLLDHSPETEGQWFEALTKLTRFLRSPDGCPWDREHTSLQFAQFVAEEGAEYCEALAYEDHHHAEEEFGDCIFVLLSSLAAAEAEGRFTLKNALERAYLKMVRRHDHVFRKDRAATPEEAMDSWKAIKAREKQERE